MDLGSSNVNNYQKPPILTDDNYPYWKSRMEPFLCSIDEQVWSAVIDGYSKPKVINVAGVEVEKNRREWTPDERMSAGWNSKALNAILAGVDRKNYKHIQACKIAKDAWDKLETIHEGTTQVRKIKLRMLNTQFQGLAMKPDEPFAEFEMRMSDIINQCENLGKTYPPEDLVAKILASLPSSYHPLVTSIEQSKDVDLLDVSKLIGISRLIK